VRQSAQGLKSLFGGLAVVLALALPALPGAAQELQVTPNEIEIGAFFQGARVEVKGEIPPGSEAVMEIMGQPLEEHLMRKGRRGILWMNVGELQVQGAPSLYLVASTNPNLLTPSQNPEAPWGYQALKRRISFAGHLQGDEQAALFQQFLQLKESEELYSSSSNPMPVTASTPDKPVVQDNFSLPAKIAPGTYRLRLSVVQHGQVVSQKSAELKVAMIGFPAFLSSLAYQHEALYGILAVVIALAAGFLMGVLFKGKGGSH
jgi:hypothetical protein